MLRNSSQERGTRICERNNSADTKAGRLLSGRDVHVDVLGPRGLAATGLPGPDPTDEAQSITSRVACWAGGIDALDRGEPSIIPIRSLSELSTAVTKAACTQEIGRLQCVYSAQPPCSLIQRLLNIPQYLISAASQNGISEVIADLEKRHIISRTHFPYNSPVWPV
ncbi:hypothetical protein QYF61_016250 [Mycteria americana]|uniref:Uncharacterized protein n=1 Tax=Mycteria americana TaxID=33587 RepID=A0AAN7MHF3_MYCAM|nr:hypothetical protein QYF61_016250 [Mycteria americana]